MSISFETILKVTTNIQTTNKVYFLFKPSQQSTVADMCTITYTSYSIYNFVISVKYREHKQQPSQTEQERHHVERDCVESLFAVTLSVLEFLTLFLTLKWLNCANTTEAWGKQATGSPAQTKVTAVGHKPDRVRQKSSTGVGQILYNNLGHLTINACIWHFETWTEAECKLYK